MRVSGKQNQRSTFLVCSQVIQGEDVVFKIEQTKTDADDVPTKPVVIFECGSIPTPSPFQVDDNIYK